MTATRRVPRLQKRNQLSGPPLFLVPGDLAEQMEELCEELDICMALDPDSKIAVYRSNTVAEVCLHPGPFHEQQGLESLGSGKEVCHS